MVRVLKFLVLCTFASIEGAAYQSNRATCPLWLRVGWLACTRRIKRRCCCRNSSPVYALNDRNPAQSPPGHIAIQAFASTQNLPPLAPTSTPSNLPTQPSSHTVSPIHNLNPPRPDSPAFNLADKELVVGKGFLSGPSEIGNDSGENQ